MRIFFRKLRPGRLVASDHSGSFGVMHSPVTWPLHERHATATTISCIDAPTYPTDLHHYRFCRISGSLPLTPYRWLDANFAFPLSHIGICLAGGLLCSRTSGRTRFGANSWIHVGQNRALSRLNSRSSTFISWAMAWYPARAREPASRTLWTVVLAVMPSPRLPFCPRAGGNPPSVHGLRIFPRLLRDALGCRRKRPHYLLIPFGSRRECPHDHKLLLDPRLGQAGAVSSSRFSAQAHIKNFLRP